MQSVLSRVGAVLRSAALAGLLVAGAVAAAQAVPYTSLHVFGDSLSDTGNLYDATFRRVPDSPPYWRGRFSNGPVWAEHLAAAFEDHGRPASNQAWGNAQARTNWDGIPDLRLQASLYRRLDDDRKGDRPLFALWAGSNDILNQAGEPGIRKVGRRAAEAVGQTARSLARTGGRDFLILDLPDLGTVPLLARGDDRGDIRRASRGTRAFNRQLDREIALLRDRGLTVTQVSTYRFLQEMIADPRAFGVRNVTTPCIGEDGSVCSDRQARRRAFFDDIHPNKVVHRRLGEIAIDAIFDAPSAAALAWPAPATASASALAASPAPVPLPAPGLLLAAGLAALGLAGFRRARR